MAVSKDFEIFLTEALSEHGKFSFRRMFGGIGIYSGGVFFAVVDNDQLFFRVSESDIPRFESHGMGPFAPIPGKPPMRTYYQIPEEVVTDRSEFPLWIRRALQAAMNAKKPKSSPKLAKKTTSALSTKKNSKSSTKPAKRSKPVKLTKSAIPSKRTGKK